MITLSILTLEIYLSTVCYAPQWITTIWMSINFFQLQRTIGDRQYHVSRLINNIFIGYALFIGMYYEIIKFKHDDTFKKRCLCLKRARIYAPTDVSQCLTILYLS